MRTAAALLLCLWLCRQAKAQSTPAPAGDRYKASVRFNFAGLADPIDNNISFGGEMFFHPDWSLTTDLAYIEYSSYFSEVKHASGYIIKPAVRYYPSSLRHTGFLEAVLFYKKVNYCLHDWLGKDCVDDVPTYYHHQDFAYNKRVAGFNLQFGVQPALSRNNLLRLEAYLGLGIRIRQQDVAGGKNCCYNNELEFGDVNGHSGFSILSSLPIGVRLVYCIR